jgi:hypothetical protein
MRHLRHVPIERHPSSPFFGILLAIGVAMVGVAAYGYYRVHTAQPFKASANFLDANRPPQRP